ncbi:hypothetical protein DIPPA_23070, partial [Diplonema papillatum]
MCPLSRAYRPDAAPAAPPADNHRRRAPAAGQAADPAAGPAHAAFEEEMPFSFAEVSALAVPKLERIPLDAQLVVAAQLAKALQLAATGSVTGWLRLHSFATLVLFKPRRGGRKKVAAALRSRCHLWAHGRFGELWTEAQEVAAGRRQAGVPPVRFLVMDEDDNQIGRFVGLATDVEDADQLDAKTVQQVIRKTKARWFGKAVAALSAAKVAPVNEETLGVMREKHPQAPEPPLPPIPPQANAEIDVSWGIVIKTLRALPRGTAPGPSGLSAQHLLDLVSPGSPIRAPLVAVIARIATGSLPDEARPHGFGARLVALEKKDGGLRPIACGEVLRRMAAKILARDKSVVQAVKPILERCGQTGVGMKSGADAMVCAMRCVGEAYRRDGQGRGILKVDLQNAFNKLDARAFYLDDGAAAGLWEHLIAWLAAFELEGGAVGMHLNRGKSEVVCLAGERVPDEFAAMTRCSLESWEILGAPCGSEAAVREAVAKVLDRAEKRARAIASLPDPHTALALLNSCAGFVCVVSLMRATGPVADYGRVDAFMRRALARTLGAELGDTEWVQASLPLRLGGLGMHSCADSAAVAGVAATLEGIKGLPLLTRAPGGGPLQITLTQDSVCAASLACPRLALFPEVLTEVRDSLQAGAAGAPRKQKEWSGKISGARQAGLLRDPLVGVRGQARIRSCAAKHASTWLYGAHNAPDDLWMSPAELTVAVRLRLGMQLAPQARECRLCGAAEADRFGDHSLTCLNAGLRTRAHTALRNEVGALAREALLCPVLEDRPFTKHPHRNKRVDVAYTRGEKRRLIDVAITFPLQANAVKKAAETEGGAATKYEAVKRRTYDGPILAEAPEQQDLLLVPMVVDTFGAWGESALPELRALVNAVHRRHDWETYAAVSHLAFHRLSFVVARAVARIALVNADVHLGARRVEEGELELDEISTDDGAGSSSSSSSSSGSSSGGGGGSSSSNSSSSVASGGGGGGGAPEGGGGGAPGGPQAPAAQGPPPLPPPNDEQSQEGGQGEQGDEGRAPGAQAAPRGQVQGEVMPITGGVEPIPRTAGPAAAPEERILCVPGEGGSLLGDTEGAPGRTPPEKQAAVPEDEEMPASDGAQADVEPPKATRREGEVPPSTATPPVPPAPPKETVAPQPPQHAAAGTAEGVRVAPLRPRQAGKANPKRGPSQVDSRAGTGATGSGIRGPSQHPPIQHDTNMQVEEAEATRKDILKPLEAGRAGTASSRDGWRCAPPRATPSEPYRQRPRSMGTKRDPLGVEDGPSSSVVPPLPPAGPTPKPQSWEILGAPCGSEAAVREAVAKVLDRAEKRARAIASLPDPHTALALLNSCAGFVCVVSLMRATGPVADYGRVDAFMRRALARTLGAELGDTEWVQASLPLRLGGLGMHSCADSAAVAGVAATLEGIKGLPLLTRAPGGGPLQITLTQDSVCAASLACPRLALFPEVLTEVRDSLQAGAAGAPRKQKEWSGKISGARQAGLLRDPLVGVRGQARIRSCAAKHASTWLYGAHNAPDDLWMSPAELTVAVRLRLGMQLAPQARECRLCGAAEADRFGDHSLTCLNAGLRTRAHTALRNEVGALAREALLCPVLEDRPFTKHPHRNKRVDVAYTRGEKRRLIDVAITFPLQANAVKKAAETEGGAATKYEAVKRRTYDGPILAEAPEQQDLLLVPMVVDTFGAWGESALPELRALVNAVHRRHDWETYAAVSHLAFHRLSFVVARAVARIALVNADVHLGARRVEEGELELDEISTDDGAGSSSSSSSSSGSSSGGGGGSSSSNSSSSVASGGGGGGGAPEGGGGGAPGGPQAPAAQGPPPLPPPNDEQSQEGGQ